MMGAESASWLGARPEARDAYRSPRLAYVIAGRRATSGRHMKRCSVDIGVDTASAQLTAWGGRTPGGAEAHIAAPS